MHVFNILVRAPAVRWALFQSLRLWASILVAHGFLVEQEESRATLRVLA